MNIITMEMSWRTSPPQFSSLRRFTHPSPHKRKQWIKVSIGGQQASASNPVMLVTRLWMDHLALCAHLNFLSLKLHPNFHWQRAWQTAINKPSNSRVTIHHNTWLADSSRASALWRHNWYITKQNIRGVLVNLSRATGHVYSTKIQPQNAI